MDCSLGRWLPTLPVPISLPPCWVYCALAGGVPDNNAPATARHHVTWHFAGIAGSVLDDTPPPASLTHRRLAAIAQTSRDDQELCD